MKLTKSLVAIAAASALLVLAAAPASATVHVLEVTGGTLTTAYSGFFGPYTLGPGGTMTEPCTNFATDTDTFTLDETGTGTPTTTALTAVSLTSSQNLGTPTAPYVIAITKHTGNNTGTVTSTGAITQNISLRVEFKNATGAPTCVPGSTVCTFQLNGTLTGTATAHPLATSTNVDLSGTAFVGTVPFQACSAPVATLITTHVILTHLSFHVTT